jgi:hypothetical protein
MCRSNIRPLLRRQLAIQVAHDEVDELLTREVGAGHDQSFGFVANNRELGDEAAVVHLERRLHGVGNFVHAQLGGVVGRGPLRQAGVRREHSVMTSLGLIRMTRTFDGRSSARQHSVMPRNANLLA